MALVLRDRFVTGRIAPDTGSGSENPWTPCLYGLLPVAIDVHSIGESTGLSVAKFPIVPRAISAAVFGMKP